jgi:hypothetical protein
VRLRSLIVLLIAAIGIASCSQEPEYSDQQRACIAQRYGACDARKLRQCVDVFGSLRHTGGLSACLLTGEDRKWLADGRNDAIDPFQTMSLVQRAAARATGKRPHESVKGAVPRGKGRCSGLLGARVSLSGSRPFLSSLLYISPERNPGSRVIYLDGTIA